MSADNCIAILRTRSQWKHGANGVMQNLFKQRYVWRVVHTQGLDQFHHLEANQKYNIGAYMLSIWGDCDILESDVDALELAKKLQTEVGYTEYGIVTLDTDYVFYGD